MSSIAASGNNSNNNNKSTTPGWRCTLCSEPFSEDQLERHVQEAHIGRPQASWKCGQCAFLTGSLGKIGAHFIRTGHSPKLVIQMNEYTQYPLRFFNCLDSILVHHPEKIEVPVVGATRPSSLEETIPRGIPNRNNKRKRIDSDIFTADERDDRDEDPENEDPDTAALWASLCAPLAAKKGADYSLLESTADGQQLSKFDLLTPAQIIPSFPPSHQRENPLPHEISKAVVQPTTDDESFSSLWSLTVVSGSPPAPQTVEKHSESALGSSSGGGKRSVSTPFINSNSRSSSRKRKDSAAKKSAGRRGRKGESVQKQEEHTTALLLKNTKVKEEPMGVSDDADNDPNDDSTNNLPLIAADDSSLLPPQKESSKEIVVDKGPVRASVKGATEENHDSSSVIDGTPSQEEHEDVEEVDEEDRKPDLPDYHQAGGNTILLPPKYKYRCDMCDRNFTTNSNWRRHERDVHHREKRTPKPVPTPEEREAETIKVTKAVFICRKCNAEFRTPQALKEHMEISGVRLHIEIDQPFACPLCPRRFSREASLKIHASLHPTSSTPAPSSSSLLPSSEVIMGGQRRD